MRFSVAKKLIALLAITLLLSSCSFIKEQLPEKKQPQLEKYVWANEAHSSYGYNQLDEKLKRVYKDIADACLSLNDKVTTDKVTGDELHQVILALTRDYPVINWLGDQYKYATSIGGKTTVTLIYTVTKEEVNEGLAKLNGYTTMLLQDISPKLSDYEKALMAHDKIVTTVEYDLNAENQHDAYGAIVNKRATCEGYAKAYQFLLLKLGIESLIVYGQAEQPHAWNMVKLDGDYYLVDTTFDDRDLSDGGHYLSREFMFLTDKEMSGTHTPSGNGTNYLLPSCTSNELNYFVKNELVVNTSDRQTLQVKVKQEANKAIKNRETSFQLKFQSNEISQSVNKNLLLTGIVDNAIYNEVSKYKGVNYAGRTFEEKTNVITFVIEYK